MTVFIVANKAGFHTMASVDIRFSEDHLCVGEVCYVSLCAPVKHWSIVEIVLVASIFVFIDFSRSIPACFSYIFH